MFKPAISYTDGWRVGECLASSSHPLEGNNMAEDIAHIEDLLQARPPPPQKKPKRMHMDLPQETVIELAPESTFGTGDIPRVKKCSISQEVHFTHVEKMKTLKEKIIELGLYDEYSKERPPRPVRVKYRVLGGGATDKEKSLNRKTSENWRNEDYTWTERECVAMAEFLTCNGTRMVCRGVLENTS